MEIKILGIDCPHCRVLKIRTTKAVNQLRIDATVEHIEEPEEVWSYGLLQPPAVVVDGHIVSQGRMLTIAEIKKILLNLLEATEHP